MNSNRSGTSWGFTRHVAFEILKTFSFSLLVLELSYSLFISIMVAERYNLDLPLALPVMWYTAAGLLSDSLPLALMFASSLVYGRLVADREIMAARSFGMSNRKILLPVLILGVAFTASGYFINGYLVPLMKHKRNNVSSLLIDQFRALGKGQNRDFRFGNLNLWIMEHEGRKLKGVFVGPRADSDSDEILSQEKLDELDLVSYPYCIYAGEGTILFPDELRFRNASAEASRPLEAPAGPQPQSLAGHIIIELRNVSIFYSSELHPGGSSSFFQRMHLDQWTITFDPASKARRAKKGKELNNWELGSLLAEARSGSSGEGGGRSPREVGRLELEYHGRFARMLSCGVFALMGGLIALYLNSGNRLLPFFVSCAIVPTVFYSGTAIGQLAGDKGFYPWLFIQAGNVILCAAMAWSLWRLETKVDR